MLQVNCPIFKLLAMPHPSLPLITIGTIFTVGTMLVSDFYLHCMNHAGIWFLFLLKEPCWYLVLIFMIGTWGLYLSFFIARTTLVYLAFILIIGTMLLSVIYFSYNTGTMLVSGFYFVYRNHASTQRLYIERLCKRIWEDDIRTKQ
jgi:hypothetical protein